MPPMSITLVPIGKVDPAEIRMLKDPLEGAFSRAVVIGEEIPLPAAARNAARNQYDAETALEFLSLSVETAGDGRVLGVTNADLYFPGMNFVFGMAGRRCALISLHRLRPPFYSLPEDAAVFRHRAVVEAVHELGHTFGLAHCKDPWCVMRFSNTIAETDRKGPAFCTVCRPRVFAGEGGQRRPAG
ncbi:archaemetzincin family Zn-dependent metalloprotease [Methanoculleus sp.]|uniref:archaemetzincin family Zn-dependent metalloprotease n=2 Tax=Methanoculleus sp. TaxID=90427 RepID=UPI001BD204BA|nr:archaemetzincin family Zn-dependent metalloprotease [Methanoculleus sp.]